MNRREFVAAGASGAAWSLAARAQQRKRIGVLTSLAPDDPEYAARLGVFLQTLQQLGWTDGLNLRLDYRWGSGDAERIQKYAVELVALAPDVILADGAATMAPLQQATRTVPIVFAHVTDPVGAGFVDSLARPGGNATGFMNFEYGISAKWLELLKQVAPGITRVAVIRSTATGGGGQLGAVQTAAASFGLELTPLGVRNADEIEHGVAAFARGRNGGMIVTSSVSAIIHRKLIIGLAAQHRLPAIYPYRYFADDGGLMSYGPNQVEQWRFAAGYIDRILRGEKPADLPVQAPTRYELVINLKAAKALGVELPQLVLARADEVIE